jgi:hypothetical protein
LAIEFDMEDLGMMYYFMGLKVWQKIDDILDVGL